MIVERIPILWSFQKFPPISKTKNFGPHIETSSCIIDSRLWYKNIHERKKLQITSCFDQFKFFQKSKTCVLFCLIYKIEKELKLSIVIKMRNKHRFNSFQKRKHKPCISYRLRRKTNLKLRLFKLFFSSSLLLFRSPTFIQLGNTIEYGPTTVVTGCQLLRFLIKHFVF